MTTEYQPATCQSCRHCLPIYGISDSVCVHPFIEGDLAMDATDPPPEWCPLQSGSEAETE